VNSISRAFILKPEKNDTGMWQAGTVNKLAKVFVVRNHNPLFIDGNIQYRGIIQAWKYFLDRYDVMPEPAQFFDD
jgi:hypothetical protein